MPTLTFLEETLSNAFNEFRDELAEVVTDAIEEQKEIKVYDLELGNWVATTVNTADDDIDEIVNVTSTVTDDDAVTIKVESTDDSLFEGQVVVELTPEQAIAYRNMMMVGQVYDIYEALKQQPSPELTPDYNPYALPVNLASKL